MFLLRVLGAFTVVKKRFIIFVSLIVFVTAVIGFHHVPRRITLDDQNVFSLLFNERMPVSFVEDYDQQIEVIRYVQSSIFEAAPVYRKIEKFSAREPEDLIKAGYGYCFDRARSIDKALRFLGFETRYASLYSIDKVASPLQALLRRGGRDVRSHAVVEVKTDRGWLVVDTVHQWLALDENGDPLGLDDLHSGEIAKALRGDVYFLYKAPFTYVYGLYSRHGLFYPPYNFIPDLNIFELRHHF